ncbi:M1 family metallopeptidase [Pendulispora brunnea]|uniref:Aminopeptidase n=1 Tax=Pendulispora brunnea TaxID=2905690 RepID=A0ABZ2KGV9_9BACT
MVVAALFVGLPNCTPAREAAPAATSAARPAPWPEPPGWRLPDTVRPTRYDASLTVLPTEPRFEGRMRMELDLRAPAHAVWLHAVDLTIRAVTVNGEKAEVTQGKNDLVGIRLPRALPAGAATVVLDYSGPIAANGDRGLIALEEGGHRYAFAAMEPIDARRIFPCFDEPSFKVPWTIRLEVKREDMALSNAPAISEQIAGDHKIVQFAETKPLPPHLLALAVGPFEAVDAGVAGKNRVPIRILVPPGRGAEARFAKESTGPLLNRIEAYLDMPYPYEKLDFVNVPHYGGAMESPGLVTFAQKFLLSRPEEETSVFQRNYASIAAHELGHQWFGNLVTMKWWDDMWLSEAFAPWLADRAVAGWKPEWHLDAENAAQRVSAMLGDDIPGVRRLRQPIDIKDDMAEVWTEAMYSKGTGVLDMFEQGIGRDAFRQGLRRYLATYAHGNATAEQFLQTALHDTPPATVRAFESFLNQPGVPQVDASLRCETGRPPALELSQSGKSDATWQIPVCARYPGKRNEAATSCTLLGARQGELVLDGAESCPVWVDANSDAHGYYRVRYLGNLLTKLLAAPQALTRAEKVALLGDLGAQARSGASSYTEVLAAASKLAGDTAFYVAAATLNLVVQVRDTQLFPEPLRPNYARFVRDTYGARAKQLGFAPRAGESEDDALLRPKLLLIVADYGEDPALRGEAKAMGERWLNGQGNIPPALLQVVLNVAARFGDRSTLDLMRNAARARAANRKERNSILRAMGQFREPDLLRAALATMLTNDFDVRESIEMLRETSKTAATRQVAFDFVKEHFDALVARLPNDGSTFALAAELPEMVGASFCDAAHAADVESFFRGRTTQHAGGTRSLARAVERVKGCAAYRAVQEPNVTAFLSAIKDGSGRKTADGRANRSASSTR